MKRIPNPVFVLTLLGIGLSAPALELSTAEAALTQAVEHSVKRIDYSEKAGAYGIYRRKTIVYAVSESPDGWRKTVVSIDQPPRQDPEDPREPIAEGDVFPFDLAALLKTFNPFVSGAFPVLSQERIKGRKGGEHAVYRWSGAILLENGQRMVQGELCLDEATGMPRMISAEQLEYGANEFFRAWRLEFAGSHPGECRLITFDTEEHGKFGIIRYKYYTHSAFHY